MCIITRKNTDVMDVDETYLVMISQYIVISHHYTTIQLRIIQCYMSDISIKLGEEERIVQQLWGNDGISLP